MELVFNIFKVKFIYFLIMVFLKDIFFSIFLLLYHETLFYAVHIVYNYVRSANMLIIFIIFNKFSIILCYMRQYFYFKKY